MARTGNHGQVIPRDRALLHRLYWVDGLSHREIAERYGVNTRSVHCVFKKLGIPVRAKGKKFEHTVCVECGMGPVLRIRHAGNGSYYGKKCAECRRQHYNRLSRDYIKLPRVREYRKQYMDAWKITGNLHPKDERQWLNRSKHLRWTALRVLRTGEPPSVLPSQSKESARGLSSPDSCRPSSETS